MYHHHFYRSDCKKRPYGIIRDLDLNPTCEGKGILHKQRLGYVQITITIEEVCSVVLSLWAGEIRRDYRMMTSRVIVMLVFVDTLQSTAAWYLKFRNSQIRIVKISISIEQSEETLASKPLNLVIQLYRIFLDTPASSKMYC